MKEKKEPRYYHGMQIDSDEEQVMLQWLEELAMAGYISKIERADTFRLSEPLINSYIELKQLKKSVKNIDKEQKLLEGHVYTPEFKVTWEKFNNAIVAFPNGGNRKRDEILLSGMDRDNVVTYLEVKPEWDQNNMERLFKINQKWMWEKYQIYVNLVKPAQLMANTFTPDAYLLTATGKKRMIHWPVRSLQEWLNTLNK